MCLYVLKEVGRGGERERRDDDESKDLICERYKNNGLYLTRDQNSLLLT